MSAASWNSGQKKKLLAELIDLWDAKVDHPLARSMIPIARVMARGSFVCVDEAKSLLEILAPFNGQYAALAIVSCSCEDCDGVLEAPWTKFARNGTNAAELQETKLYGHLPKATG